MSMRFAHVVNPYGINGKLDAVQTLTLSMLEKASKNTTCVVRLLSAQFGKDRAIIPPAFHLTDDLTGSVGEKPGLPLLREILDRANNSDCDYVIWSNMDIVPVPRFYDGVQAILQRENCDALIINRRRVSSELINNPELLLNETGKPHPGYDCFIIRKELLRKMKLGNVCVGAPGVGFMLAHNLFLFAEKCVVYSDKHLTLHAGMKIVQHWKGAAIAAQQRKEIVAFLRENRSRFDIRKFPGYNLGIFRRHWKWLLNPLFHYPLMFSLDMKALFDGRKIKTSDERDTWWQEWKSSRINFD